MRYSWSYGIFHWFVHYSLTILFLAIVDIKIFPNFFPFNFFTYGFTIVDYHSTGNILDILSVLFVSSLVDFDHLPALRFFGRKKYIHEEKRYVAPLHNFFFLAVFSIAASFSLLFFSKVMGVLFFSIVLHMMWDILEDVLVFKVNFRKWEKTWGINIKEMEDTYNELTKPETPKKDETLNTD
ncbi:MAG: hypothetical protein J4452_04595 [Candidatus Aenigmarchaeota archaeon]|nr:hypothetical protein [Candidatus Aenigmarchaeota archaeon]